TNFCKLVVLHEETDPRPKTADQSDAASSLRLHQRDLDELPPSPADPQHEYFRRSIGGAVSPRSRRVELCKLEQKTHRPSRRTDRHNAAFLSHGASELPRAERN